MPITPPALFGQALLFLAPIHLILHLIKVSPKLAFLLLRIPSPNGLHDGVLRCFAYGTLILGTDCDNHLGFSVLWQCE